MSGQADVDSAKAGSSTSKDQVFFVSRSDDNTQMSPEVKAMATIDPYDPEDEPGLLLPNGDINWSCPCMGGMVAGPCGYEFREAFSCFHYSRAQPKGSDCYEKLSSMSDCMAQYPNLYGKEMEEDELDAILAADEDGTTSNDPAMSSASRGAVATQTNTSSCETKS